jgi:hypothetical protein
VPAVWIEQTTYRLQGGNDGISGRRTLLHNSAEILGFWPTCNAMKWRASNRVNRQIC